MLLIPALSSRSTSGTATSSSVAATGSGDDADAQNARRATAGTTRVEGRRTDVAERKAFCIIVCGENLVVRGGHAMCVSPRSPPFLADSETDIRRSAESAETELMGGPLIIKIRDCRERKAATLLRSPHGSHTCRHDRHSLNKEVAAVIRHSGRTQDRTGDACDRALKKERDCHVSKTL